MTAITFETRPFVAFVKGQGDCCYPNAVADTLASLGWEVWVVPWNSFSRSSESDHPFNDAKFLAEGENILDNLISLDRPVILVGHSFGGDSILKLLPRLNRRIALVGVIDPVAAFGYRSPLLNSRIPPTVISLFNRWQANLPWPIDIGVDGNLLNVEAQINDQEQQDVQKLANGETIRRQCGIGEFCKGRTLFDYLGNIVTNDYGDAAKRLYHQDMPHDELIQTKLLSQIRQAVSIYRAEDEAEKSWIANQYPLVLNRPATQSEVDDAHRQWRQGRSREQFQAFLINTPEAANLINQTFQEMLERSPTQYEFEYERSYLWIGYYRHHRYSVAYSSNVKFKLYNLYREMLGVDSPVFHSYDWDSCSWTSDPAEFLRKGGTLEYVREAFRRLITTINQLYSEIKGRNVELGELQKHVYDLVTINRNSASKPRWTLEDVKRQIRGEITVFVDDQSPRTVFAEEIQRSLQLESIIRNDSAFATLGAAWSKLPEETKESILAVVLQKLMEKQDLSVHPEA